MKHIIACLLLATSPAAAFAFDCAKATSEIEKTICANPDLKAEDDAMSEAYARVRELSGKTDRQHLALSQKAWLREREGACAGKPEIAACLLDSTRLRTRLLAGLPEGGPGAGSMIPVFRWQAGDNRHYKVDSHFIRFAKPATPGERLFNEEADKLIAAAPLERLEDEIPDGLAYENQSHLSPAYASPRMISAAAGTWSFDGGAHGNGWTEAVNIDLKSGKAMRTQDMFSKKAAAELYESCKAQVAKQKGERGLGEEFANYQEQHETIRGYIGDMKHWVFYAGRALITFDSYVLGSYVEGGYECEFPLDRLKALANPGAPLPE